MRKSQEAIVKVFLTQIMSDSSLLASGRSFIHINVSNISEIRHVKKTDECQFFQTLLWSSFFIFTVSLAYNQEWNR